MGALVFRSRRILTPEGVIDGYVTLQNGKIMSVAQGDWPWSGPQLDWSGDRIQEGAAVVEETILSERFDPEKVHMERTMGDGFLIDVGEQYLSPGFIDLHTHGGGGHDFMDGTEECFERAAAAHMRHGTTALLPTTLTSSTEELYRAIDCFKQAQRTGVGGPELLGLHLEGPYFNPKQAGAQDSRYLKSPDPKEYKEILDYGEGAICRWSVAVELEGALELGDLLRERGIIGSIGHSNAELGQVEAAYHHGYRLLTHFYSAMSGIVRKGGFRRLGIIESGYLLDEMDVEIIADGCHLPPELLRMICKLKDNTRISLVTDSMRGAGMPDGSSILGSLKDGQKVVIEDGVAKLPDRTAFAGSVATTDRLVRVMCQEAGLEVTQAVRMATENPARVAGVAHRKGRIAPGYDGDLVIFDNKIRVSCVVCKGHVTWIAPDEKER